MQPDFLKNSHNILQTSCLSMIGTFPNFDFISGEILLFDKDLNWSSFDLVKKVRNSLCRSMGIKKLKVGHAGTLDPLASGLLILCTGKSTKKIEEIQSHTKEYIAEIKLGATTPSYDMETEEDQVFDVSHINEALIREKLKNFVGEIDQTPPIFSAVKIGGERAYNLARKGDKPKLKSRKVVIDSIELLAFELPKVSIKVTCGKGTYIRSLANDIGQVLQCGAYLTGLRRTMIGEYKIEDAISVDYFLKNLENFVTN